MKWYIWVAIALLVVIIIAFMVSSSKKKKAAADLLANANATIHPESSFDPFNLVQITKQA